MDQPTGTGKKDYSMCFWLSLAPIVILCLVTWGTISAVREHRDTAKYEDPADRYYARGDYQKAAQNYLILDRLYPHSDEIEYKLGLTYRKEGQLLEARKYFVMAKRDAGNSRSTNEQFTAQCQAQIDAIDKALNP